MFNDFKLYMKSKHETQVSKNRYGISRDAEEQPPTVQQSNAETNEPIGDRESAPQQGKHQLKVKFIFSDNNSGLIT